MYRERPFAEFTLSVTNVLSVTARIKRSPLMVDILPFIQLITFPGSTEPDALLGFSFPFLPDMLTSRWFAGATAQERLYEALRLQVNMIKTFWGIGVAAWDLRFVGTDDMPGISIGLLCRLRRPERVAQRLFREYCFSLSRQIQQMFADYGYEAVSYTHLTLPTILRV